MTPRAWQGVATAACVLTLVTCSAGVAVLALPTPSWVTAVFVILFVAYAAAWALASWAAHR